MGRDELGRRRAEVEVIPVVTATGFVAFPGPRIGTLRLRSGQALGAPSIFLPRPTGRRCLLCCDPRAALRLPWAKFLVPLLGTYGDDHGNQRCAYGSGFVDARRELPGFVLSHPSAMKPRKDGAPRFVLTGSFLRESVDEDLGLGAELRLGPRSLRMTGPFCMTGSFVMCDWHGVKESHRRLEIVKGRFPSAWLRAGFRLTTAQTLPQRAKTAHSGPRKNVWGPVRSE